MVEPAAREAIGQRADHVLLAHELGERLRPPLAGKDLVRHRETPACGSAAAGAGAGVGATGTGGTRTPRRAPAFAAVRRQGMVPDQRSKRVASRSPALAENRCGCFLPDLTRFTTMQCGATRR